MRALGWPAGVAFVGVGAGPTCAGPPEPGFC